MRQISQRILKSPNYRERCLWVGGWTRLFNNNKKKQQSCKFDSLSFFKVLRKHILYRRLRHNRVPI